MLILLVALSVQRALDFSVFPSLLLITTLFRLGLNVATTRLILGGGNGGTAAAGHVIETFGQFAVGGSLIVGAVIFLILLVVNFAVITKGSGRIAEVAARFTLDALPGKQMSIDADLAAGIIDDREAKARRTALEKEIEFFGAMDGASKFVRGDAVAGLVITAINMIGGLAAGLLRDNMSLSAAAETYFILTIGDGLVSQIPALLVSTAAGIIVTRAGSGTELGPQVGAQIFRQSPAAARLDGAGRPGPGARHARAVAGPAGGRRLLMSRRRRPGRRAPLALGRRQGCRPPSASPTSSPSTPSSWRWATACCRSSTSTRAASCPAGWPTCATRSPPTWASCCRPCTCATTCGSSPPSTASACAAWRSAPGTAYADRLMVLEPAGGAPHVAGRRRHPGQGAGLRAARALDRAGRSGARRGRRPDGGRRRLGADHPPVRAAPPQRPRAGGPPGGAGAAGRCAARRAPSWSRTSSPAPSPWAIWCAWCAACCARGSPSATCAPSWRRSPTPPRAARTPPSWSSRSAAACSARSPPGSPTARAWCTRSPSTAALEEILRKSLGQSDGEPTLAPDVDTARRFIAALETRAASLVSAGRPAVIIAPSDLRRPLFDFASRFVTDLWVITARELVPGTAVEPAGTIETSSPNPWSQAA